ncbi:1-phosphofructokinase [Haloechinothrix halophila]|uniref:1-phosphofructokinase n=1 Tax=Haloechinothrix halophila TaxID=1069073 RepID=UPI0003FA49E1|nr:1-phosphofructokinase [Haloechinothrix halophila]
MIVTVTANPSLDRTVEVDQLRRGEVQRALTTSVDAGGKGVNVSRALVAHGRPTRAVLCSGGFAGLELLALLRETGVPLREVPVTGGIRSNLTLAEPDGTVTKLNEPGPRLSTSEVDAMLDAATEAVIGETDWVAGCGSLPPGMPVDIYARLTERAHALGASVAVDTSGAALDACLAAGPDLVKPNLDELAACAGAEIRTLGDAVKAAQVLRDRGAGAVLASLGADGAILLDATGARHATARLDASAVSTVGAGDATLAGYLAAGGIGDHALRAAVTWGAAAVTLPGSSMPTPNDLDRVTAEVQRSIDPARVLTK